MTHKNQIVVLFSIALFLGLIRFAFMNNPEFTLIKKERIIKEITTFSVPEDMTEPMIISLEFAKYLFDQNSATFIEARETEEYKLGHIENSINIPYDYYEDYEEIMDGLDEEGTYITYCSGGECSLSIDLADYLYNEKLIEKILIFEGGWPLWRDAGYP